MFPVKEMGEQYSLLSITLEKYRNKEEKKKKLIDQKSNIIKKMNTYLEYSVRTCYEKSIKFSYCYQLFFLTDVKKALKPNIIREKKKLKYF